MKLQSHGAIKLEKPAWHCTESEWDFPCDCGQSVCLCAHACIQVLWLKGNHMQPQFTHWDSVPVPETTPGQEAYCGWINGSNLASTLKWNHGVCISWCYIMITIVKWFKPAVFYWRVWSTRCYWIKFFLESHAIIYVSKWKGKEH